MRVLGIDPGTTRVGYAIVSGTRDHPKLVASGVLGDAKLDRIARLSVIGREIEALIQNHRPDAVVVETLFFSKNVTTALLVAEARGVILLTAYRANLKVYEYAPKQIKIAVTGNGNATKPQVEAMTKIILKHNVRFRWDDESDAIAVAIAGLVMQNAQRSRMNEPLTS